MELGMAASSGWCNIVPPISPPKIWTNITRRHENHEDLRRVIARHVAGTADQMRMEIYTFQSIYDMLKDIVRLDIAPRGSLPVWLNLQRGMCILNLLPTSASQVAKYQRTEQNYRDTAGTHTFVDA